MEKIIRELYKRYPPPIAERAIQYIRERERRYPGATQRISIKSNILLSAFLWNNTKEGSGYWNKIYKEFPYEKY